MQILKGHISAETAFVVDDYPYGFALRCKIRYWIEYKPKMGFRFVSQTTNPKRPGEIWNKPKTSTYSRFGAALYLDDKGHVQWAGLSEYCDGKEAQAFLDTYGEGVSPDGMTLLRKWVASKLAYDANRQKGDPLSVGLVEARRAFAETAIRVVRVFDPRQDNKLIARHDRVARELNHREVLERFGIAEHLRVTDGDEISDGAVIQRGTEGQSVVRYVGTYVNGDGMRTLMTPAQGRHTYATREEAQAWVDAVTSNNSGSTIRDVWGDNPRFEVRPCPCWSGHFDPQNVWFD